MKKTLIGLSLVALAASGVAIAQPMGGPGRDAMADKTVTRAEAQARAGEMFAKMDANKDGKLDAADREAHRAERRAAMFARLDTDKNGSISRDEFNAARQRPEGAGKWGDGKRGEGQRGEGHRGHGMRGGKEGRGTMMLGMADTDKDRAISRDEFLAAHAKHFDMADANKDGQISPDERKAARAKMREHMRGMKGGEHARKAPAGA